MKKRDITLFTFGIPVHVEPLTVTFNKNSIGTLAMWQMANTGHVENNPALEAYIIKALFPGITLPGKKNKEGQDALADLTARTLSTLFPVLTMPQADACAHFKNTMKIDTVVTCKKNEWKTSLFKTKALIAATNVRWTL